MSEHFEGSDMAIAFFLGIGLTLLVCIVIDTRFGFSRGDAKVEAAEAGHAEFFINEDHERAWRWLPAGEATAGTPEGTDD